MTCVAFKTDNPNILVSCSADKTIKMWDITSGSCVSTLRGHKDLVRSLCFSPCGTKIVSGGGKDKRVGGNGDFSIWVWDVKTGVPIGSPLRGHSGDNPECWCEHPSEDNDFEYTANPECPVRGHRYVPSLSREYFLSILFLVLIWCV